MDLQTFPIFSCDKLAVWFAQAESAFAIKGVESDSDMYDYIVAHIPTEYTSMVEDIILNPPIESRYDTIKFKFIRRMSIENLNKEEMGNSKPSEYLERLKKMADERVPNEEIMKIWLKKLPAEVSEIVSLEETGCVESIGLMADKIMLLLSPLKSQQQSKELEPDQLQMILQNTDDLVKQLKALHDRVDEVYELVGDT